MFGLKSIDLKLFPDEVEYQIAGGQCKEQPLTDEWYPIYLPPFAQFQGNSSSHGTDCQIWDVTLPGAEMQFCVASTYNATTNKTFEYVVDAKLSIGGVQIFEMSFSNITDGVRAARGGAEDRNLIAAADSLRSSAQRGFVGARSVVLRLHSMGLPEADSAGAL